MKKGRGFKMIMREHDDENTVDIPVNASMINELQAYIVRFLAEHPMSLVEINMALNNVSYIAHRVADREFPNSKEGEIFSFVN